MLTTLLWLIILLVLVRWIVGGVVLNLGGLIHLLIVLFIVLLILQALMWLGGRGRYPE